MSEQSATTELLSHLNPRQREATVADDQPLLIIAGAGTGKTLTLVHRVAWQLAKGVDPARILLLTFTRRAAAEMLRRVDITLRRLAEAQQKLGVVGKVDLRSVQTSRIVGGTFHAVATRLLRQYAESVGLSPDFTIHDRPDSEDLMNVLRGELGLAETVKRFPRKGTCMAIYSRCVNSRRKLGDVLEHHYPWCVKWQEELAELFKAYVQRKRKCVVLDYDDLLVYWLALVSQPAMAEELQGRFDRIMVDEYQDTNRLQSEILLGMAPKGRGVTVVGDDAQSIYSFRAATVRNILDFPSLYDGTEVVRLEQNYRSTQPILEATNNVIAQSIERYEKTLWTDRLDGPRPVIVLCEDENDEASMVARRILERREDGIDLRRQAVLFRASHHSMTLETELSARDIPYHKYGGLKYVETAHVKDLMAILRLAENPRDVVSATRILPLIPGIGAKRASDLMEMLLDADGDFSVWQAWKPPKAAEKIWPEFLELIAWLYKTESDLPEQLRRARLFYDPLLEQRYESVDARRRDLEQLEQISTRYDSRRQMLQEITLEPPSSTQDLAGPPHLDDDYLVLSTIHSAKGLEWDTVFVIHTADGNIPSDMATGTAEEIDEELRLFYVALTRAKNRLYVVSPRRFYFSKKGSGHSFAQQTRFLPDNIADLFDREVTPGFEQQQKDKAKKLESAQAVADTLKRMTDDLFGD